MRYFTRKLQLVLDFLWLIVGTKLQNDNFDFLDQIYPIKVFPAKKRKSEHRHDILHIWISLSTKSQLKLKILSFWTEFIQKGYFQWKTEPPA